jgi:hypothetical protein
VDQILPYLDTYSRAVWPAVITIWLYMGVSDMRRRMREGTHPKSD